jgi:hypothetical protein
VKVGPPPSSSRAPYDLLVLRTADAPKHHRRPTLDDEPPRWSTPALRADGEKPPLHGYLSVRHLLGWLQFTWWLAVERARQDPDESLEQWVIRTRIEQGLPPHVEEIETLRNVIALLGLNDQEEHE